METRGSVIIAATIVGMLILVVGCNPEAMVGADTTGPLQKLGSRRTTGGELQPRLEVRQG